MCWGEKKRRKDRDGERMMFGKEEWKDDVEGGHQERRKVVKNVMSGMREKRKNGAQAGQGNWSDEVDGEGERKERQERGKGKDGKFEKNETFEEIFKVQKVEKDGMVEKVGKVEESQKVQKVVRIENVMNENEGLVKTPQIQWDFRQSGRAER